jgi:hypothetical protein
MMPDPEYEEKTAPQGPLPGDFKIPSLKNSFPVDLLTAVVGTTSPLRTPPVRDSPHIWY